MTLSKKQKMSAIMAGRKICRLPEKVQNEKYKKYNNELRDVNTRAQRKEWIGVIINILEEHFHKCSEDFSNQTIPNLDY